MEIGHGDYYRAVHIVRKAGKSNLVIFYRRGSEALYERDSGKHYAGYKRRFPEKRCEAGHYKAEARNEVDRHKTYEQQEKYGHPMHAR